MTENEVINKIYGYLKNQNEHIIMENMTNESVSLFWENISVLYKAGVLQNNKAVKRFCDKLRIRTGYDRDQCLPRWSFGFMLLKIVILTKWIRN